MSDDQKAKQLLSLIEEGAKAALIAISEPEPTQDSQSAQFSTLRTDFISILSLLHAATTKVALSLKPSAPQYKASLTPLKDLSNNVAALVHSIKLMRLTQAKTILKEYEAIAKNVIRSIESFAHTILHSTSPDEYLRKAGEIHELIDHARKPGVLSFDNHTAVGKKWRQDHESLEDGFSELKELCQPADDEDEEDDGWGELGFESNRKLTEEEIDRAAKIEALIKLIVLLHKKVLKSTLAESHKDLPVPYLDTFADISDDILCATDELVSSLYGSQDVGSIGGHAQTLLNALTRLKGVLIPSNELSLEDQMAAISISGSDDKTQKWFATCFQQIEQAGRTVIASHTKS